MLADLDKTLSVLLQQNSSILKSTAISFAPPDGSFPPSSINPPAIDLFLYDIRENLNLRTSEWIYKKQQDNTFTKQPPPVIVDCSYLITAWASQSVSDPAHDEHMLLSEVLRVLLTFRQIPSDVLQGALVGQEPPLRVSVLQQSYLQSVGEFWHALGGKPKATLNYTITLAMNVQNPQQVGGVPVEQSIWKFGSVEEVQKSQKDDRHFMETWEIDQTKRR